MPDRIRVNAPGGGYDIHIGSVLVEDGLSHLRQTVGVARCVIVTNTTLEPLYSQVLKAALPEAVIVTMPDGEQHKTMDTVGRLYEAFVRAKLDRAGVVIAFGGGVVGDTAGFAAATFMRGVRLIQIPTSLLSMVDSSVGGKVGVDLPIGKNLVGAFKQPDAVFIDPTMLTTLPAREWRCGMAEVIKHGLLADSTLLDPRMWAPERVPELIRRAVQVKVNVVEADPYEQNVRAHLNLGHTFAHAIEQVSGYAWPHGEAVGVGLVAAARLSVAHGLAQIDIANQVETLVAELGLPTRIGELSPEALYAAMSTDKKWAAGKSRFVLLRRVGEPLIAEGIDRDTVLKVLQGLDS
ncbi:MAG: 3-dehydroquinate synthase [Anaerolineae bacterium]|nr:3-dehydroquinate synthase [Anaerolineae bacterium]